MSEDWTDWIDREDKEIPPYQHWADFLKGELASTRDFKKIDEDDPDFLKPAVELEFGFQPNPIILQSFKEILCLADKPEPVDEELKEIAKRIKRDIFSELEESENGAPKIPRFSRNEDFKGDEVWLPDINAEMEIQDDSVIVGVIDRGIALGHQHTRFENGKSRILAAWQQVSDRSNPLAQTESNKKLPFGTEFLSGDLNIRLEENSIGGDITEELDEDGFNRSVGTDDFFHINGHRELGRRSAHGSHVLSTAAGIDATAQSDLANLIRIITVNLPDRSIVGLSSRHLEYFVRLGIARIVGIADKIWDKKHGISDDRKSFRGYPVVINLSFAKQAGAKDGDDGISRYIKLLNRARAVLRRPPVYMIVPSGNDNLQRSNAHFSFENNNRSGSIDWRILPADQSSNYVEIWTEGAFDNGEVSNDALEIEVTTPDNRISSFKHGQPGQIMEIPGIARVYCEKKVRQEWKQKGERPKVPMIQYLVCTAPTLLHEGMNTSTAPAGNWKIRLRSIKNKKSSVILSTQTDQSDQPESTASGASYFDDQHYERFHANGRSMDTYNFPDRTGCEIIDDRCKCKIATGQKRRNFDDHIDGDSERKRSGSVRRHGSMNAILAYGSLYPPEVAGTYIPGSIIVGGYRYSDGKPSDFSSTGYDRNPKVQNTDRRAPLLAFPTDYGYAHRGWHAAGARDGSKVAMRGTSFAAAQMTNCAAKLLLENRHKQGFRLRGDLFLKANEKECAAGSHAGFADIEKTGAGRLSLEKLGMDNSVNNRVPRS